MDISEKQAIWREQKPLFEAEFIHSHLLPFFNFNENTGDYEIKSECVNNTDDEDRKVAYETLNTGWVMWLRAKRDAKAQAVPEGFVLVKKELPEQIAEKMAIDRIDKPRHENDPVWSEIAEQSYKDQVKSKKWEFWRDYKAMIEAQEPKITELKIDWGMECPKCNHNEATIHSTAKKDSGYEFMHGDAVTCNKCGNTGEMDAQGEDSDIVWNEDETND